MPRIIDFDDGFESSTPSSSQSVLASEVSVIPSGNLSSTNVEDALHELQTDIDSRALAASVSNIDNTSDATKNSAVAVLTNKDIDGGVASNSRRITLPKETFTNLTSLTRKQGTLVFDTTSNKPFYDDGSNLKVIGSGSGGTSNLIEDGDAESGISNFTEGSYSAATRPSGTFTSSSGSGAFTISTSSTQPLSGSNSFILTKSSGASRQGRAIERTIDLDFENRAKCLQYNIKYVINSGTFVSGTNTTDSSLIWYIAEYNGSTWSYKEPDRIKMLSSSTTISDTLVGTFQTNYDTTQIKLIAYVAESADSSWSVKCEVAIKTTTYVYGSPVTDPVAYTPTFTGFGTATSINVSSWKDGAYLFGEGTFTAGTTTATQAQITMGYGGANANVTSLSTISASLVVVGKWSSSTTNQQGVVLAGPSRNYLVLGLESSATNGLASINGSAITTGSVISFNFRCPIQGWSSSVQMSEQTDTRIVLAKYRFTSAKTSAPASPINFNTLVSDTHNAVTTGASWKFTAPIPGKYFITVVHSAAGTTVTSYLYKNGSQSDQLFTSAFTANNGTMNGTAQIDLVAGDYIDVRLDSSVSINTGHIIISRISGPTAIAATESVNVAYGSTAGSTIGTSYTLQTFTASEIDTHGCWNGTDTFTAQIPGQYSIGAGILTAAVTLTTSQSVTIAVYKNGVLYRNLDRKNGTGASNSYLLNGNDLIRLKAGETLQIYAVGSVATSQSTSGGYNKVTITRVGN